MKTKKKMQEHTNCCAGQAGFNFMFDNGKIVNYQDNFKKIGDLPFAIYYDFETTTGSVLFFDAKMYVVSYCIIIAFHPDLNLPRLYIYRSYDQNRADLTSLHHFEAIQRNFFNFSENFNLNTLKQLEIATLAVENKKDNRALAEMFNIELKFTVDCLKFWFERNLKQNELDEDQKDEFIRDTPKKTCICNFPIQSRAEHGWFEHVCKAEYLFSENIFSAKEMYQMGISTFEIYFDKIKKILDSINDFCNSIEHKNRISILKDEPDLELDYTIQQIKNIKIKGEDDKEATKKKSNRLFIIKI